MIDSNQQVWDAVRKSLSDMVDDGQVLHVGSKNGLDVQVVFGQVEIDSVAELSVAAQLVLEEKMHAGGWLHKTTLTDIVVKRETFFADQWLVEFSFLMIVVPSDARLN